MYTVKKMKTRLHFKTNKLFFYITRLLFGDYLVSVVMTYVRDWYSHYL